LAWEERYPLTAHSVKGNHGELDIPSPTLGHQGAVALLRKKTLHQPLMLDFRLFDPGAE
jgi:hypothetical protein